MVKQSSREISPQIHNVSVRAASCAVRQAQEALYNRRLGQAAYEEIVIHHERGVGLRDFYNKQGFITRLIMGGRVKQELAAHSAQICEYGKAYKKAAQRAERLEMLMDYNAQQSIRFAPLTYSQQKRVEIRAGRGRARRAKIS